jgi:anti-sigma B factor antagonist
MPNMADEPPLVLKAHFGNGVAQVHVTGDLDLTTASALADMLAVALDRKPGRLVVDLRGVGYLDCAAARVIAEAARALPGHEVIIRNPLPIVRRLLQLTGLAALIDDARPALEPRPCGQPAGNGQAIPAARRRANRRSRWVRVVAAPHAASPVIVRPARPAATRPLQLTGLNSAGPAPQAAARHDEQLLQQVRMTRARMAGVTASIRTTAGQLASTVDRVAVTLARMAELHPDDAARLSELSAAAQELAARSRRHAVGSGR